VDVAGKPCRTIWLDADDAAIVRIIDQRLLPHHFVVAALRTWEEGAEAIRSMQVRGAPLVGATAAWSLYLAAREARDIIAEAAAGLQATRPTAVNLRWAIERSLARMADADSARERCERARAVAEAICEEDVAANRALGEHGLTLIERAAAKSGVANVLTHCNAGWLATVDVGTATAPIYLAQRRGVPVHVWVDETRPRNQGAALTAWELGQAGVPHTVIVDNAGGHLMQRGRVDLCIVGTDRTARSGDVANKIGTYLKALAAHDNGVPFYVAAPSSSIDWRIRDGLREIPIEERSAEEVSGIEGLHRGHVERVRLTPLDSPAHNPAFDVTPARLVTGLVTERGVCDASESGLLGLFPEHARDAR
jgi:methylthioribose-1-phosphate isomerase